MYKATATVSGRGYRQSYWETVEVSKTFQSLDEALAWFPEVHFYVHRESDLVIELVNGGVFGPAIVREDDYTFSRLSRRVHAPFEAIMDREEVYEVPDLWKGARFEGLMVC